MSTKINETKQQAVSGAKTPGTSLNSRQRKIIARKNRKGNCKAGHPVPTDPDQISPDVHVYTDDSYIDKRKKFFSHGLKEAKERIKAKQAVGNLKECIETSLRPLYRFLGINLNRTTVLVINRDGRVRDFLPDVPGDHRILVHGCIAKKLVSGVCMLVRITKNEDSDGNIIDGSWAIVPAEYRMMRATTIQHLKRRPWFFLRRYWYEISFDGRVQPAHMLFDYGLNPIAEKTRFHVTHEFVPVRDQDITNDYFRFWHKKPK